MDKALFQSNRGGFEMKCVMCVNETSFSKADYMFNGTSLCYTHLNKILGNSYRCFWRSNSFIYKRG